MIIDAISNGIVIDHISAGKAKAAIRRATRAAIRDQYAGLGRRIVCH